MGNKNVGSIILVINCLLWIYTFIRQKRRTNGFGPCLFVILTYCIYAISSLILFSIDYEDMDWEISFLPMIYLFVMLWISLLTGMKYEQSNIKRIQQPSEIIIYCFIILYGASTLFTLTKAIQRLQEGVSLLLSSENAGAELYLENRQYGVEADRSISGLIGIASIFHNFFRDASVFVLFYYLSLKEKKKAVYIYLLIVLFVDIMISISEGGRTLFMMILFITLVAYYMFRDYWDEKFRRFSKIFIFILLLLMATPFVALTVSRFEQKVGTINSLVYYTGSANLNFNDSVWNAGGIRYGDRTINEVKRIMGFDVPNGINNTRLKYASLKIDDGRFSTFIGDFVLDFGKMVTCLIVLFFSFLFLYLTRTTNDSIPFHSLLLVYFTLCICAQGGMYLFYYSFQRFWIIVAFFLMYVAFLSDYSLQKGSFKYLENRHIDLDKKEKQEKAENLF